MLVFKLKDNQPIKAHEKQGPCLAIWEIRTCADVTWKFKKTVVPPRGTYNGGLCHMDKSTH
jgi:hypothetical protein